MTNTPGYNCRLQVGFKTDKNGRRYAYYYSHGAGREIRVSLDNAELWVAAGFADLDA